MSIYSKLYWLTRLDNLHGLLIALTIIGIIATVICLIVYAVESEFWEDDDFLNYKKNWGWMRRMWIVSLITGIMLCFLPTKNEVIFIIAGGKTIEFATNDSSINKIPGQATKILSDFIQKQISEIKADK